MSSTRSRRKRGARDSVIDRVLAVKRAPLVTRTIELAATGKWLRGGKKLASLDQDLEQARKNIRLVGDIRERLADVPAQPQRGTLL